MRMEGRRGRRRGRSLWREFAQLNSLSSCQLEEPLAAITREKKKRETNSLVFRQKSNLVNGGSGNNSSHCLKVSRNPPDVALREKKSNFFQHHRQQLRLHTR